MLRQTLQQSLHTSTSMRILPRSVTTAPKKTIIKEKYDTSVKPYHDIPKVDKVWRTTFAFLTGKYSVKKYHEFLDNRVHEFGPIYREKVLHSRETVFTANPDDFKVLFEMETRNKPPVREGKLWALDELNKNVNMPPSLLNLEGDSWLKARDSMRPITRLNEVTKLVPELANITNAFVTEYIPKVMENKDTALIKNMKTHLDKWTFECIGMITFGESFGMFKEYDEIDPIVKQIFENGKQFVKSLMDLQMSILRQHNKTFNTTYWKTFEKIMTEHRKALKYLLSKQQVVIENDLTPEEVVILTADVMAAGVDTIAETSIWTTIELSLNPNVQDKIYEEVMSVAGDKSLDGKILQKLQYTRGVLKEVFRVRPLNAALNRVTRTDTVLSGYTIPEGTPVTMLTKNYDENKYFKDPHVFQPERWIRSQQEEKPHPFAVMPFSEGMRSCPGRRIAESEILLYIATLMRHYKIEPVNKEISTQFYGLLFAEDEIDFIFHRR